MGTSTRTSKPATAESLAPQNEPGLLGRRCGCGNHTVAGGECSHCRAQRAAQPPRTAVNQLDADDTPGVTAGQIDRSFANVRAVINITAPDAEQAELTRQLLQTLAARLGLRADSIQVHVDGEAERRTIQRNARGVMRDGVVYLNPRFYRPQTREGRYLLGHEVAHVAQRSGHAPNHPAETAVLEAELEADRIGEAFASGSALIVPQVVLPAWAVAADADTKDAKQKLADKRKELDSIVADAHRSELARMIDLLSYGIFDWAITDEDVRKVLTILATFSMVAARSLAAALPDKYHNRLLDNLDTDHYKTQRTQVLAVYWSSDNGELSKYSSELRKAFETMDLRQLDVLEAAAAQYAIQSMDEANRKQLREGKQREEIEEILAFSADPDDEAREVKQALEEEQRLLKERAEAQKAYTSGERHTALQQIVARIKKIVDGWISYDSSDAQAQRQEDVFSILRMLEPFLQVPIELRAIADNLMGIKTIPSDKPKDKPEYEEQYDYLDELIRRVPVQGLYVEENLRRVFLSLVGFRPPYKNEALAEELASTSFWVPVDSEDAYLAFLLVKAMPPHTRKAFFSANGGENWDLVMKKMSQQQRESESLNLYSGGKDQEDRNNLMSQLISDEVWGPQSTSRLDGLIRMAIAAGEHEFVFNQSKQREAYIKEWLKPLVQKYRLFDPTAKDDKHRVRDRYYPDILEGTAWYENGFVGLIYQKGIQGLDFVFSSDNVEVATKSVGGTGLNLYELQDMFGGNFMGARFSNFEKLGQEGKEARQKKSGVNFANVKWDTGLGILKMDVPKLAIDAIRYPLDDVLFQTGEGTLQGVTLELRYGTSKPQQPSLIDISVGDMTLKDVALIKPDDMKAVNKVGMSGLRVYSGASGSDALKRPAPRSGLKVPVPIIGGVAGALYNTLFGGISSSATEMGENLLKPTVPMEFRFSFNSLKLDGVTTSGGQFVESIELKDVVLRGGGDLNAYWEALKLSKQRIEDRLQKARDAFGRASSPEDRDRIVERISALEKQHEHIEAERVALIMTEAEVKRLEEKRKQSPNALTPEERMDLRRKKAQLTGAVLDVGSVSIIGIAGVSKREHTFTDIHGQGRSVTAALGLLIDSNKLKSFVTGEADRPIIKGSGKDQDEFTLDVGRIEIPPGSLPSGIPKAEDAKKDFDRFDAKYEPWRESHTKEHDRLKERMELAKEREDLLVNPGLRLMSKPEYKKKQDRFKEVEARLNVLEAQAQLTHKGILLEGAALSIKGDKTIAVGADKLTASDIQKGDLHIQSIVGEHVQVSVDIRDGLSGLDEWRKNLQRLGIKGESVVVSGIENKEIGLHVDRATLMGIDETTGLDVSPPNASARIKTTLVLVEGVHLRNMEATLIAGRDYLEGQTPRTPGQDKKLAKILAQLADLEKLRQYVAEAEKELAKAKTPKQKQQAQAARDQAQRELDRWAEGLIAGSLAINDLDVSVSGLGDVLSEAYDPESVLENGLEVRGRGGASGKRMFSSATGTDVSIPGLSGKKVSLGEMSGRIVHSKQGTLFDGVHIASIAAQGIDWRDGKSHAFSHGETQLLNIDVTAFMGEKQIVISKLDVGAILADQLGYQDEATGLEVIAESGGLGGIHVTNLTIDLPKNKDDATKITGKVAVEKVGEKVGEVMGKKVDDLKLNLLIKGVRAQGELRGSNLSVDFVTDRKRIFRIGDLQLKAGEITQPGTTNNIHVSFRGLKGEVTQEELENGETKYTLTGIALANLTVGKSRWADRTNSNFIEINGSATLDGVTLDAEVLQGKKQPNGSAGELKQLKIVKLNVRQVAAKQIHAHLGAVPPDPKKPDDKGSTAKDVDLESGTIVGLEVTGLDLLKDFNKMKGKVTIKDSVDIQKLRIQIGETGKDELVTTLSMKAFGKEAQGEGIHGRELSATLMGEDGSKYQLGTIKEVSGEFYGRGAWTRFSTGQITMSPVEISGDGSQVKVSDVEIKDIKLIAPKYRDGKGTEILLDSAHVTRMHINGVVAKFGEVTEKDGKKSQGMTNLDISGLTFDFIGANGFKYTGKTTISDKETKTTTVEAQKAELTELTFKTLSHDFNARITKLDATLKNTSVTGFVAAFGNTLSKSTTEIAGDIEAGSMHADLTLTGTKAYGEDWTSVDGLFELTDDKKGLGLTNVEVRQTDASGTKTVLGGLGTEKAGFDLKGLKVKFAPNGMLYAEFDELAGKSLKVQVGGATIEIQLAKLKAKTTQALQGLAPKPALALQGLAPRQVFDVLGATLGDLEVQGLKITYDVVHTASATPATPGSTSLAEQWTLGALGGMDGTLQLHVRNVKVVGEADVTVPVKQGVIDFNKVVVEVTGPNPPMGVEPAGIYVDPASSIALRQYVYESANMPGAKMETVVTSTDLQGNPQMVVTDRGSLNLKDFLEHTLNDPASPSASGTSPSSLEKLNDLTLKGTLAPDDAVLGTGKNNVVLSGKAAGKNRISISGISLGRNLVIDLPEFQASKGHFDLDKPVETGQIDANIKIQIAGLGAKGNTSSSLKFTVTLTVAKGTVKDIKYGNVALVSEAAVRSQAGPPKGK